MSQTKLSELQSIVQDAANTAWEQRMGTSIHDPNPTSFGKYLECALESRGAEISIVLNDLAQDALASQEKTPEPPDFSKYIRYSSSILTHKEVFVGNEWVLVPNEACVDFRFNSLGAQRSFTVSISYKDNYTTFTSSDTLQSYQHNEMLLQSEQLKVELENDYVTKEERDWMLMASQAYSITKKNIGGLGDISTLYGEIPKDFKRHYAYKISKVAKNLGKPAKAGKIFHGAEKVFKNAGKVAKVGPWLSAGTIAYEIGDAYANDTTIQPHTYVDGALLVVGVAATAFGAPVVIVGLAIYGILDYAFGVSEGIDEVFGEDSDLWNDRPLRNFPRKNEPLFHKMEIDKTYVEPTFKLPRNFKN